MAVGTGTGTWVEYLRAEECWELLARTPVGRIGVLVDSAPEIYPINHCVDGGTIVFRTDAGNKLRSIDRSPSVCFEADGIDLVDSTGWSVLVKGRACELTTADELDAASRLPLRFWGLGAKPHWVRVVPREVTGRRIHHHEVRSDTGGGRQVGEEGLEPSHPYGHRHLKPARLPIPPLARAGADKVPERRR